MADVVGPQLLCSVIHDTAWVESMNCNGRLQAQLHARRPQGSCSSVAVLHHGHAARHSRHHDCLAILVGPPLPTGQPSAAAASDVGDSMRRWEKRPRSSSRAARSSASDRSPQSPSVHRTVNRRSSHSGLAGGGALAKSRTSAGSGIVAGWRAAPRRQRRWWAAVAAPQWARQAARLARLAERRAQPSQSTRPGACVTAAQQVA
jgi:hypothetical protein